MSPVDIKNERPDLSDIASGNLTLKIAENEDEVRTAQHLRYKVFYEDLGAVPNEEMARTQRDFDHYDDICDHLLVMDSTKPEGENAVGTYRILTQDRAKEAGQILYTETEYDLSRLKDSNARLMEVSRSCVMPEYRGRAIINLLWSGLAAYTFHHDIDFLLGLASFHGTSIDDYKEELGFLKTFHTCPSHIRPRTIEGHYVPLPDIDPKTIDQKRVFMSLPPLLKGYLRLGGYIGDGAYIDEQFNTVDVCIMVHMAVITDRYKKHYQHLDKSGKSGGLG